MQNELGAGHAVVAAPDTLGLDGIGRLAQAGGVNEHHGDTADVGGFLNGIARGAGGGRDDGAVVPKQLIEQTGFAGVGPTNDHGANTTAQDATFVGGGEELVDEVQRGFQSADELGLRVRRDVFIGKINVRLEMGEYVHQIVAQLADALAEFTSELFVGGG